MNITNIESIKDVRMFAHALCRDENLCFHPDDSFSEYVDENGNNCYTREECEERDRLMEQCFDVCMENKVSIYRLMGGIVHSYIYPEMRVDRIETLDDVKRFISVICDEEDTFFHAIDVTADLETCGSDKFFTEEELEERKKLRAKCFEVCKRNHLNLSDVIDEVCHSYFHPDWECA